MDIDRYHNIEISADFKTFSFISKGPKGDLAKLVRFVKLQNLSDTYNLALGTVRGNNVDYTETTDNGDRNQILATIFHIALSFSRVYPDQKIFIMGRNQATTRLYRGVINNLYAEIVPEFLIQGGVYFAYEEEYKFEEFTSNEKYDAFLFKRR